MARPQKAGVDYFSHDVDTHGKTLFTLEATYGNDGYAFWFKLLELLGKQDGLYYDCREEANIIYLAARAHLSVEQALEMLDILAKLNAIDAELWKHKLIWCQKFVNRLQDVYTKRRRQLPQKPSLRPENSDFSPENSVLGPENTPQLPADPVSAAEKPQRKVNDTKANHIKTNETTANNHQQPVGERVVRRQVIALPLGDDDLYPISPEQYQQWQELYPQVDILQELRKMKGWLQANPGRCKSEATMARFIVGWLARQQEQRTQPADNRNPERPQQPGADKPPGKYAEIYDKY